MPMYEAPADRHRVPSHAWTAAVSHRCGRAAIVRAPRCRALRCLHRQQLRTPRWWFWRSSANEYPNVRIPTFSSRGTTARR